MAKSSRFPDPAAPISGCFSAGWGSPFLEELALADLRFRSPLYAGDTVSATSEVLDVSTAAEGSSVIRAQVTGFNQRGETLVEVIRTFGVRS